MQKILSNKRLIIVLSEHPLLGMLLIPYIGENTSEEGQIHLIEQAFHLTPKEISLLGQTEQKAISIASQYTEKHLMSVYSKDKALSRFLRKLSDDVELLKEIRLFIEKSLLEMVSLIRNHNLPLYQKQSGSQLLYPHHAYHVHKNDVEIQFNFEVNEKSFNYQLECYNEGQLIPIKELKPVICLISNPTILLLGMELYVFPHIESARILPFTKKTNISVDSSQTKRYIDNILIPIACYHKISVKGIVIKEEKRPCECLLYVEKTSDSTLSLRLNFRYKDQIFTPLSFNGIKKIFSREETKGQNSLRFFRRNSHIERKAVRQLLKTGLEKRDNSLFRLTEQFSENGITEWITNNKEILQESFILISGTQNIPYYIDDIHIEQNYNESPDWFELHITVVIGNLKIPFSSFRKHILNDNHEYVLPDGRVILLPDEWFSKYTNLMELGITRGKTIYVKRPYIGIVKSISENNSLKESKLQLDQDYDVPSELKATLRPYQEIGYRWMINLFSQGYGACLADDMGLGKTLQTLALLQQVYSKKNTVKRGKIASSLIVVPTSLIHNWKREAIRFTQLTMTEYNSSSPSSIKCLKTFIDRFQLIIISYGTMRNKIDILRKYCFEYIVLDESQNIKNSDSLTFQSAIQLEGHHRLVLTGTPIENSLKDLWAQFHFLQPNLLGNESTFNKSFISPIKQGDNRIEMRLRQLISPFILRRSKNEVAPELPSLTEEVIYCNMTEGQHEIYDQEKNSLRNILLQFHTDKKQHQQLTVLNGISRLRQLACHSKMIFPDFTGTSGKLEQIIDLFETLHSEGHKVLIFSSFVKHLELVADEFKKRDWSYALLTGATINRPKEIARFTQSETTRAFLISLKAGGVGLNLTQADYVFIIDPWWNPAAETQAIARAHRIGQNKQVIAYRFITENSIEEKIIHLQETKRKLAEIFITQSESIPMLTDQEWIGLLD